MDGKHEWETVISINKCSYECCVRCNLIIDNFLRSEHKIFENYFEVNTACSLKDWLDMVEQCISDKDYAIKCFIE
jgi:hypothetical protein